MKKDDLSKMNSTQLIDMFIAICERQLIAATDFKNVIYNKLFENMRQIVLELRSRSGDHRRLLIPLTSHANPQVRLKAAIHTLAIDRDAAVAALQALAD